MEPLLLFLLTGAIAGVLAGLFGVGGGLIMVPALAFLLPSLGVHPQVVMHVAVGTSLAVISFTSISSMVSHHRQNGVRWPLFRAFAPGLAAGAVLGALLADATASEVLKRIVGIGALLVAAQMLLDRKAEARTEKNPGAVVHATAGTVIGLLSSLIGIGGGSLTVPYFNWFGTPMRQAVGTAAACGVPIAWAGALAFMLTGLGEPGRPEWSIGYVSLAGFGGIVVASVLTAPVGARLAHRLPATVLKRSFAILLFVIGLGMLYGLKRVAIIAPGFLSGHSRPMIQPHGAAELRPLFVSDAARHRALTKEAASLPSLLLNSAAAANAVMLGGGYFTPLTGYMNLADAMSVAKDMKTAAGLFWPVPVVNLTKLSGIKAGTRLALRDPNVEGQPVLAVMDVKAVEAVSDADLRFMADKIFGTLDPRHPGVGVFTQLGNTLLSGPIEVLNFSYFQSEFPDTFRTAVQIREEIKQRGWNKVVAFQTRNPMHRAHEELCRMAMERLEADGLVIHMLLGKLKEGDIPAPVRDASIRKMVELYFPPNSALVTGYGFDMLYAGPREAVLHAVFRQNMGATHLIVGRDHAGVGSFYGPFDAQTVFGQVPKGALQIEIFGADNTAWSKKLNRVVMMREAPNHTPEDFINLSGTKVRELLGKGQPLPPEFSRPEVAKILSEYYQSIGG